MQNPPFHFAEVYIPKSAWILLEIQYPFIASWFYSDCSAQAPALNVYTRISNSLLRPKFTAAHIFHTALALRTSMPVPLYDVFWTAIQAQSAYQCAKRRGSIADYATHHQWLHRVAVGTRYHFDGLPHKAFSLVNVSLVATSNAFVFPYKPHYCRFVILITTQSYTKKGLHKHYVQSFLWTKLQ